MRKENCPKVVLRDASAGAWQSFACPCEIIETCRHDEVMDCLRRVEQQVEAQGLHAAGFVSYEAAPAFDRALTVREARGFPLVWFGLFPAVETLAILPHDDLPRSVAATHGPQADHGYMVPAPGAPSRLNEWQASVTEGEYAAVIGRLRDAIAAGETYQVNYTFRLRQQAGSDPWRLFEDLVTAQPPPYAAYVETPDFALCSASPELFFELEGRRIVSRPMKGTIARGRWYEEDLARRASWPHRRRTGPRTP